MARTTTITACIARALRVSRRLIFMAPLLLAFPAIARGQCGGTGEMCCTSGNACTTGNVCTGTFCVACGGATQPCCTGNV
jgi:hypothetical protein